MVTTKKILLPVVILSGIFLLLIILQAVYSYRAVSATGKEFRENNPLTDTRGWNSAEARLLKKDIHWYGQLLMLSKTDSNYLIIDLRDSTVHLKLKGISLAEAEIMHCYPSDFLSAAPGGVYLPAATVSPVLHETANFTKKPVRKIVAFSSAADKVEPVDETEAIKPLCWSFNSGNNFRVVITGVQTAADSTLLLHPRRDILLYRIQDFISDPFPQKYSPTLYLWLNDMDAKAIYRAVPPGGNMLFRN